MASYRKMALVPAEQAVAQKPASPALNKLAQLNERMQQLLHGSNLQSSDKLKEYRELLSHYLRYYQQVMPPTAETSVQPVPQLQFDRNDGSAVPQNDYNMPRDSGSNYPAVTAEERNPEQRLDAAMQLLLKTGTL